MRAKLYAVLFICACLAAGLVSAGAVTNTARTGDKAPFDAIVEQNVRDRLEEGRNTFRYDTFGDEDFWGGALKLHNAIQGSKFGGVGSGISPKTALSLGLKVDVDALPSSVQRDLKSGKVNLDDPATTLALLNANAVVGLKGFFTPDGKRLQSVGITCAVCHSRVDDSFAPGIGHRLDGWPNQDLNVGAIIAASPDLSPLTNLLGVDRATALKVLNSWGPGKFDAQLTLDGKGFRPDGKSAATLIPPAFGLAGVNEHAWTGSWGTVTYWNAFVGNLEMHGKGRFFDPRLNDPVKYPIAVKAHLYDVTNVPDLLTPKLPALHTYQLSIPAPRPPAGSFDPAAARRGKALFTGRATCSRCHVPPTFSEPGWNLHRPEDIGIDAFQANRAPDNRYRTQPLRGIWAHQKRGFYHDGRFPTLLDVVNHYDTFFKLNLSSRDKEDIVQYLLSLPEEERQK
ncbi:MAG: hypothetical protein ACYC2Y_11525 [Armatimonadota bacterium]